MDTHQQIPQLDVVQVRFRNVVEAPGLVRVLETYTEADTYSSIETAVNLFEPDYASNPNPDVETDEIGRLNGKIADQIAAGRQDGHGVLLTGGNCCHITGVIGGLQDAHGADAKIGLVWFDAHGDFNTPHTTLSGMLGGMPVAVAAGLAFPRWREYSHIQSPLPTDRILMVDVRNLDPAEEQLIRSTDITIASPAEGFPGEPLAAAVDDLANKCDMLYFHIDADILDESYVPNHGTKEPNGPNMEQVLAAAETVLATGKVAAVALVSVYGEGEGTETALASGKELLAGVLKSWHTHGQAK